VDLEELTAPILEQGMVVRLPEKSPQSLIPSKAKSGYH
jgi:hypothetical protein